jgi:signal transduction histidine kinase/CheY-like chemotaxis protein
MPTLRTLIVEDRPDDAELLVAELSRGGYTPQWTRVDTLGDLIARVQDDAPDVVITDYSLPGMDALDVLRTIRDLDAQIPVIVVSGVMDELTCVESLRLGAADYLLKDRLARLAVAVDQALTRHRLEQEARRARQEERLAMGMLQGLVANAPAAICLQAIDGQYLLSNPSYDRLEGLAGTSERGARVTASVPQAVEYHEEVVGDRTFLSVRYPVVNEAGEVFATGTIHLDITRQKRIEADLRAARAELQARADDLDTRNVQLQELADLKSQFVACVSHELRTPLTSICGYADLLTAGTFGQANEKSREAIEIIDRNSRRLLRLIDDLLILSRIDDGAHRLNEQPVNVAALVEATVGVLRPTIGSASLRLVVNVPDDLPTVPADPNQLEQVMFNLLSNAVKFSLPGGMVTVRAEQDGDCVILSVEDEGIGIPEEDMSKVFSRFHRGEVAIRRAIPGTGLGLAVVQGIVEGHQGQVAVESAPGQGTRISVRLPLTARATFEEERALR